MPHSENVIRENVQGGILVTGGAGGAVENNLITANSAMGLHLNASSAMLNVTDNTVSKTDGIGVLVSNNAAGNVKGNDICESTGTGILLRRASNLDIVCSGNKVRNGASCGVHSMDSLARFEGNDVCGNVGAGVLVTLDEELDLDEDHIDKPGVVSDELGKKHDAHVHDVSDAIGAVDSSPDATSCHGGGGDATNSSKSKQKTAAAQSRPMFQCLNNNISGNDVGVSVLPAGRVNCAGNTVAGSGSTGIHVRCPDPATTVSQNKIQVRFVFCLPLPCSACL